MLKLDDHESKVKDDLYKIINGDYDMHFTPEQIQRITELSFLYNYTRIEDECIIFEYNSNKIKISGASEYALFNDPKDWMAHMYLLRIISLLTNEDIFKNSLKSFLRDSKIEKIIK